jgi:hypothetical protein
MTSVSQFLMSQHFMCGSSKKRIGAAKVLVDTAQYGVRRTSRRNARVRHKVPMAESGSAAFGSIS